VILEAKGLYQTGTARKSTKLRGGGSYEKVGGSQLKLLPFEMLLGVLSS